MKNKLSEFGGKSYKDDVESAQSLKTTFEADISFDRTPDQLAQAWMNFVFHYASLHVSHSNHRLPTLSGLAKRFQRGDQLGAYVAGLWSRYLPSLLPWSIIGHEPLERPSSFTAPTWSWASLMGSVYFLTRTARPKCSSNVAPQLKVVGRLLDVQCTLAGLDPTGAVSDGRLTVSGQVVQATLRITAEKDQRSERIPDAAIDDVSNSDSDTYGPDSESERRQHSEHPYKYRIIHEESEAEFFFVPVSLSDLDTLKKEQPVTCLLWSIRDGPFQIETGKSWASLSLILLLVTDTANTYIRLGLLATWNHGEGLHEIKYPGAGKKLAAEEWYKGLEERQLVIV